MPTEPEWRQWLLRKAIRLCDCEADADDLVQDCLYAFYRRFHGYPWQHPMEPDELRSARAWCCCKLRSLAIDRANQPHRQHELPLLDTEIGERLAIDNPEESMLMRITVEQFIASLPAYLQTVATLYNQGYNHREIAQMLGLSEGTVRQYMGRIKRLGREFFGIDVHKAVVCAVNRDGSHEEGFVNLSEEVSSDEECVRDCCTRRGCSPDKDTYCTSKGYIYCGQ